MPLVPFFRLSLVFCLWLFASHTLQAEWRQVAPPPSSVQAAASTTAPATPTRGNFGTQLASFAFLFLLFSLLVGFSGLSNPYLGLSLAVAFGLLWLGIALLSYPDEHGFPAMPMLMFMLSALLAVLVLIQPWYAIIGVGGLFLLMLFVGLIMQAARN